MKGMLAHGTAWKPRNLHFFQHSLFIVVKSLRKSDNDTISSLSLSSPVPRRYMWTTKGMYSTIINMSATWAGLTNQHGHKMAFFSSQMQGRKWAHGNSGQDQVDVVAPHVRVAENLQKFDASLYLSRSANKSLKLKRSDSILFLFNWMLPRLKRLQCSCLIWVIWANLWGKSCH